MKIKGRWLEPSYPTVPQYKAENYCLGTRNIPSLENYNQSKLRLFPGTSYEPARLSIQNVTSDTFPISFCNRHANPEQPIYIVDSYFRINFKVKSYASSHKF